MDIQPRANRTTSAFDTWAAAHLGQPGQTEPTPAPAQRRPFPMLPLMVAAALGGAVLCLLSACGVL